MKRTRAGTEETVSLSASTPPAISARTVSLTLSAAVTATDSAVKVSYTVPTTGADNQLADAAGNTAAAFTDSAVTNATGPALTSLAVSSSAGTDSTYAIGDTIALKATFNVAVTVDTSAGTPRIPFTVGSATKHAAYASGTGTTELVFHYTVAEGDADSDGIAVGANALALNGGTIADASSNDATLDHAALAADTDHKVDGVRPTLKSASVSGTTLTLTFNEDLGAAASLANTAFTVKRTRAGTEQTVSLSGTPSISDTTVSLTLSAAVTATDTGVKVSYAVPTTGDANKLVDAAGNTAAAFTDSAVTNATGPALTSLAVSSSAGTDSTYAIGDVISLKATFNVAVTVDTAAGTPRIAFTVGSATKHAAYASGSTTKELEFRYTVAEGDADSDGIAVGANALALNGGAIADGSSNAATLDHAAVAASASHTVDGERPTVSSASVSGTTLTLTFDEPLGAAANLANASFTVKRTRAGTEGTVSLSGTPAISGATVSLTLSAAVTATDTGVKVSYAVPTTGSDNKLVDAAGNAAAAFTDSAVTNATGPALTSLAVSSSAGTDSTYAIGDTIALKATFNVAVTVDTAAGTPRIAFTVGSATKHAAYASGSTTKELEFRYTVAEGDADSDGIAVGANALALNGGAIADGSSNAATLDHTAVAASASHTVDGERPTVSSASVSGTTLTLTFDEPLGAAANLANASFTVKRTRAGSEGTVSLSGTPAISGATVSLTLSAAVTATDTGVKVSYAVPTTGSANRLVDAAGNAASAFTDSAVTNATGPALTSLAVSSSAGTDSTYAIGDTIALKATFNVAVTVDTAAGTPRIAFTVGSATKHAAYASGSTTKELVFHYTVAEGDADSNGIAVGANALALNGGAIADGSGNAATLDHTALAAQSAHQVDGERPTLKSASVSGTTLTLTFDEDARRGGEPGQHGVHGEADPRGHRADGLLERDAVHQRHHREPDPVRGGDGDRHRGQGELRRAEHGQTPTGSSTRRATRRRRSPTARSPTRPVRR